MRIRIGILVAAALMSAGAFAACGGGDGDLTLEEYFERLQELDEEQQDREAEIEEQFDELGPDSEPGDFADAFEEQLESFSEFVDEFEGLDPPEEVADIHDEALDAFRAGIDDLDGLAEDLRDAETIEDVGAIFEGVDESNFNRADEKCRELEQVAADNDIEVELNCEEDE